MTSIFAIIKRHFAANKLSFIITAIVVFCATSSGESQIALSNGNYTWLLAILAPFFVVFYDYKKLIYLGANKRDYFLGSIAFYGVLALGISAVNTLVHIVIDPLNHSQTVINLIDLCGWTENGIFIAFIQQAVFLLLVMLFLHVLLSMQGRWYGWATDCILIAIISVFTPIAPLRRILANFFTTIMFNNNAISHIGICLVLSVVVSLVGLAILKRKSL